MVLGLQVLVESSGVPRGCKKVGFIPPVSLQVATLTGLIAVVDRHLNGFAARAPPHATITR